MDMKKRNRARHYMAVCGVIYIWEKKLYFCVFSHQGDVELWQVNVFLRIFAIMMILKRTILKCPEKDF